MKNKIFAAVFALMFLLLSVLTLSLPKKEFSDNENRYLAVFPELSLEGIKDGSFFSGFSTYLADHFVLRDVFVTIKSAAQQARLNRENNGVFKGSDGYLIDTFDKELGEKFDANLSAVKDFGALTNERFGIVPKVIIAPTQAVILKDKLPLFASVCDTDPLYEKAAKELEGYIDVNGVLSEHKTDYIYYRTDHHWTGYGAYYAANEYRKAMGFGEKSLDDCKMTTAAESFFGTTYSRYGCFNGKNADQLITPDKDSLIKMSVKTGKGEFDSIYFPENLEVKDKYTYFLGGNDSIVTVTTENTNGKHLLLIKDSYANSFLPFIVNDFEKISIVDMRYYKSLVLSYIETEQVTDILILYNVKSFCEDKYIQFICFTE